MDGQQEDDREAALTVAEIIKRYKVGKTLVFAELKSGRLRSYKHGRLRRVTPEDARQWQQALIAATEAAEAAP